VSLELAEKVTGHWHVPDDLIRLDAEMQAKEDAYFASKPDRWCGSGGGGVLREDPDECFSSLRSKRQTPVEFGDELES
jgi:hypothetical protein